jgi:glycosyltransferase involved in cell wall biosynthesis
MSKFLHIRFFIIPMFFRDLNSSAMMFTIGLPITKTKYLKESLESIQRQSFRDFEVIIRNNAKSPETKAEIKQMCQDLMAQTNVQYEESNEQLSMANNFNKALEKAKGEFFVIMSDDDIMKPDFLEGFYEAIQKQPHVDVFHCRIEVINGDSQLIEYSENCPEWESRIDFIYQRITKKRTLLLSDFVVRTSVLKAHGGFPNGTSGWGIDEVTWFTLCKNGVGFTPRILLIYRTFTGNVSYDPKNLKRRFLDLDFMENSILDIIRQETAAGNNFYPKNFLENLMYNRTKSSKDHVLIKYALSRGYAKTVWFYLQNKHQISFRGLVKALGKKMN